ncbi:MAG: hypothetical protein GEU73_08735 [Chloroflexi bacterium]|nr:hypothetical protein [Chloroflexota bacterium]
MDPTEQVPQDVEIPGAVPERWETAIEDAAQLIAIGLDRAQDLADVVNDLVRTRPALMQAIVAAAGGALVGAFIAGRRARHGAFGRQSTVRRRSVVEQATAIARDAADRVSRQAPRPAALTRRLQHVNGTAVGRRAMTRFRASRVRDVAELLPVALTLLRNPIVRRLIIQTAMRAARRR